MDKTLIIMQGIPGSGKSTVAEMIASSFRKDGFGPQVSIHSTDNFWGDEYSFDPNKLGIAHRWNQDRVRKDMLAHFSCIIVDNTNIKQRDIEPYLEAARQNGYGVQFIRVTVDTSVALARNAKRPEGRRVPEDVILRMAGAMEDLYGK